MKTREELLNTNYTTSDSTIIARILEVLVDIRDILDNRIAAD